MGRVGNETRLICFAWIGDNVITPLIIFKVFEYFFLKFIFILIFAIESIA
jgi:hypothetical protein